VPVGQNSVEAMLVLKQSSQASTETEQHKNGPLHELYRPSCELHGKLASGVWPLHLVKKKYSTDMPDKKENLAEIFFPENSAAGEPGGFALNFFPTAWET
jgi:hypothetical protein